MMIPVAENSGGLPEEEDASGWSYDTTCLLKAVDEKSLETLEALLSKGSSVNAHGGAFHETPLHRAAQQGWEKGLRVLLSSGATTQSMNQFGQTPLHYAAASKSSECVMRLLDSGCHATLDHRDMRGFTPLHDASAAACPLSVELLLKAGATADIRDRNEETPLHKAAKARCIVSMISLMNNGADLSARDKAGESVLRYILRHLPAGMDALLDHCLLPNSNKLSYKKLEVAFNFIPLAGSSEMNQMKILRDIVDLGHPKLLLHPVCEAFLLLKWRNVRRLFFIEVIFYFVHAFLATFLILDKFVWEGVQGTVPEMIPRNVFYVLEIILFLKIALILLKQVLTIIQGFRTWLFSLWHVLNGVIPVLVLMVVPGDRTPWQHHFATVTLLLIWVQCMLHIGRFPGCGIYVAMFTRVAKVFLRIFLIFFCLLFAFSLAFYVGKYGGQPYPVPSNNSAKDTVDKLYSDPIMTFIKTLTMMIGELDFDEDFVDQLRDLPVTSHIIFLAFVILVSIILSNLLVALAVNDVQGLRNSAHLERLIKQMELVFQMERTFGSLFSLASTANLTWLLKKIKLFVHDYSNLKVFVRPFHPQKGEKMVFVERGVMRVIGLRQNHVANVMECLRLREEENTSARKLSVRKSRQVRSEYSAFHGDEDELKELLKAIESNLLEALGEKMDQTAGAVKALSARMTAMEELCHKGEASPSPLGGLSGPSPSYLPSNRYPPPLQPALQSVRRHIASVSNHAAPPGRARTLKALIARHSEPPPLAQHLQPKHSLPATYTSQQQQQQQQQQHEPTVLQQETTPAETHQTPKVQFEMVPQGPRVLPSPPHTTTVPNSASDKVQLVDEDEDT